MTTSAVLPRTLGFWSSAALVVGITIGSGIFRSPAGIAARVPDPLSCSASGRWRRSSPLCGALSLAELAAALPETGGFYAYLREGWGRPVAFLFGWSELVLIRASALGGIAVVFGDYCLRNVRHRPGRPTRWRRGRWRRLPSRLRAGANIVGANLGAAIVGLSTAAKSCAACGSPAPSSLGGGHGATMSNLTTAARLGRSASAASAWRSSASSGPTTAVGDLSFAAGEVKDPQRNLPRAIIVGTLAIVGIYLLANVAYLYVLPIETIGRYAARRRRHDGSAVRPGGRRPGLACS